MAYCAVIIEEYIFFQGFFIVETPAIKEAANKLASMAMQQQLMNPQLHHLGILQSVLVDGAVNKKDHVVAAASLAIKNVSNSPYFVVHGKVEKHGTTTSMDILEAMSDENARDQINNLPVVLKIKEKLMKEIENMPQEGNKRGFH